MSAPPISALTLPLAATESKESAPALPADADSMAAQIKQLEKQVAELESRFGDEHSPRVIVAGTATLTLGCAAAELDLHARKTRSRGRIADWRRLPRADLQPFSPGWLSLVRAAMAAGQGRLRRHDGRRHARPGGNVSYIYKVNKTYLIDWIVLKK